ncbi:MAG: O-antigen ligase family protein [Alphaproteobacteria bacterium]|nr:O-antigen ligase family protein [Alphaproteobacteria bacterium]
MKLLGRAPALASAALLAAVALTLPLALAAPLGLAPLLVVAAAAILIGDGWPRQVDRFLPLSTLTLAVLVFWGALSAIWSIDPVRSASMAARLALTFGAGAILLDKALRLDRAGQRRLALAAVTGAGIGILLLLAEILTDQALLRAGRALLGSREPTPVMMNRAATVAALMVWPAAYAFYRLRGLRPAITLFVATLVALWFLENTTAFLACLVGLTVCALAWVAPKPLRRLVIAGSVAGILAAPYAVSVLAERGDLHLQIKPSAVHRLMIWQFTVDRIDERPWLGWGLESARELPGGDKEVTFTTRDGTWTRQSLPLHTHNAALQIRVELGILGPVLFAILVAAIGFALGRIADRPGHAVRLALLATTLTVSMASYGIWQFWWLAAIALALAAMVGVGLPDLKETDTSEI